MPISIKRAMSFDQKPIAKVTLRVPQARVLRALLPDVPTDPPSEWPVLNRANLGVRAGYTAISGSITRALNGICEGSSSGDAHLGLVALKLVDVVELDLDGVAEDGYRITQDGIAAMTDHIARHGDKLPPVRDAALCVNTTRGYKNPHVTPPQTQ